VKISRTALVVSGGGSKGAFAVGAIEVLREKGWVFDVVSGTSTGALIAPLVAIDDIDKMVEIYTTTRTKDIIRLNWRRLFQDAIYDTKPLEKLIRRTMKGERYERLMASTTTVLLCSVAFQTGRLIYGSQHRVDGVFDSVPWGDFEGYVRATLASTNEPMLMPPVLFDQETCFDGGVREVAPLRAVLGMGMEKAVVIANSPEKPDLVPEPFYQMKTIGPRALDLMTTELLNDDLQLDCGLELTVIRPLKDLPSSGLSFVPEEMQEMREIGQERAREILG
jgi:predicted acylesterase/phospholipase RssA